MSRDIFAARFVHYIPGAMYRRLPGRFNAPGELGIRAISAAIRDGTLPEDAREYVADLLLHLAGLPGTCFKRSAPPPAKRGRPYKSISEKCKDYSKILEAAHATPRPRRSIDARTNWLDRVADAAGVSPRTVERALLEANFEAEDKRNRPIFDENGKCKGMTLTKRRQ